MKFKISVVFRYVTDQTLKNQEGNIHLWCLHKRGVGRGVLKICQVFADSIILNNRSIANFCGLWKWEGHFLVISCGCHKWVTSKTIIISKKSLESKRVRNSRNFNLIIRHTVTYHFTLVINIKTLPPHLAFTSSKPTIEPREQCVEYVQS